MHEVRVSGHYGEPIIVDQCEKCGGIWFDESELFRTKQGEAEKIEALNVEIPRTPSPIENAKLTCPRDSTTMHRFADKSFPQDIVFVRCPMCHGMWLNRGIFGKYQQFRQGLMGPKKRSAQDEEMRKKISELIASYESGGSTETLRGLGEFLSAPSGPGMVEPMGGFLARILRQFLIPF